MKPFEPAPPAKDMEVRLKHNEFRDLVNELRDTADRYGGTDQLRDQLAGPHPMHTPCPWHQPKTQGMMK